MGGAEIAIRLLADTLLASGHDVTVFAYSADGHKDVFGGFPRDRLFFQEAHSLTATLSANNFDVVHATTWASAGGLFDAIDRARYRGSTVVTCHGTYMPHPDDSRATALTAVSEATCCRVHAHVDKEVELVFNGIDLDLFRPVPCDQHPRPTILWVGRPHDLNKDFYGFASLVGSLAHEDLDFLVVSADNDERSLSVREWFPEKVSVMRHVTRPELPAIYSAAAGSGGMLVSTSISEGMPLCVLEAMACGCPVVAPDVGGIGEVIASGRTGVLYNRQEGIRGLGRRVLELAADHRARNALAEAAMAEVRSRFSAQSMTEQYLELYTKVASSNRPYSTFDRTWRAVLPGGLRAVKRLRQVARRT